MSRALGLYAAALYAFLHLPLVILGVFSFNASRFTVWEGFSLRWYGAALSDPSLAEATVNSIEIATLSTLLATAVGTACAYGLWRRRDPALPRLRHDVERRPCRAGRQGERHQRIRSFAGHELHRSAKSTRAARPLGRPRRN